MEASFAQLVRSLADRGYTLCHFEDAVTALEPRCAYLRHDVQASELDAGLQLAALHQRMRVPGSFHLAWDAIEGQARLRNAAAGFRDFDKRFVRLGLHCDPVSRWLANSRFGGDSRELTRFVLSPHFARYLGELNQILRHDGEHAPALRELREGAWQSLIALDRSFRTAFGASLLISGRGSPLSGAYLRAREIQPELAAVARWVSPIDFLIESDIGQLGYTREATRFAADHHPGPTVIFGGAEALALREALETRTDGGGGFVAIFPAHYWQGDRLTDLLPAPRDGAKATAPRQNIGSGMPSSPVITRESDLTELHRGGKPVDKAQLTTAARRRVGTGIDISFPRFIASLRSEGYDVVGFDDGPLRFDRRCAYLRYDVHVQDLLAAYVLAEWHERLSLVGSFQITWEFSRYEEELSPYFARLLEFDRRFVGFGLHVAPTASWYLSEKLAGDPTRQVEAVSSEGFTDWVLDLAAAYRRDGDDAPPLRELRQGTDDTLSRIATSFQATFGRWKSVSGHGNFLSNGFAKVCANHPEVNVLQSYFNPVDYLVKWGVQRFGFDFEVTSLGYDPLPFPRILMEGAPEQQRRRWYQGRISHGLGFVALLHPATWTCRQNAAFFLPEGRPADVADGEDAGTAAPRG